MIETVGYAARSAHSSLDVFQFQREEPRANEMLIEIDYCGVCHSDVHQVKNEWKNTIYPCMPGHEIIGHVTRVGADVTKFKVGDRVGVGCMIDSCQACPSCEGGLEQYCEEGFLATYNGNQRNPTAATHTFGGYSDKIVVREEFVLRIPDNLKSEEAAPILCAGVTTYSPLRHWSIGPGMKVGIAGFGGLGDMALKLAVSMGAEVTMLTTKKEKVADALRLGAKTAIVMDDEKALKEHARSLDFILNTIPTAHDPEPYTALLNVDGVMTIVGCFMPLKFDLSKMLTDRKSIGTSLIGGISETQEVLDYCAEKGIVPDIRVIDSGDINDAFAKIDRGAIDYRFVIDVATLRAKKETSHFLDLFSSTTHEEHAHSGYGAEVR